MTDKERVIEIESRLREIQSLSKQGKGLWDLAQEYQRLKNERSELVAKLRQVQGQRRMGDYE